jgi:hypothetical protein
MILAEWDEWFERSDPQPPRVEDIITRFEVARQAAMARLNAAPVFILGQEICLDPSRFIIEGDKIHILSEQRLAPLHFAGALHYQFWASDFIDVEHAVTLPYLLVPPISWTRVEGCLRLSLEMMRSGWTTHHAESAVVELPSISDDPMRCREL